MELKARIHEFIQYPFPLWETTLTNQLVQHQWKAVERKGFSGFNNYSTARVWFNNPSLPLENKIGFLEENSFYVEMSSPLLQLFYDEHGLDLLSENEIEESATFRKLTKALSSLQLIQPLYDCITNLVRSIHILRQPDKEIDLSYSHPKIPFSIFLSTCENDSTISNLRVAESILHEAMHLKLTLIENIVALVKPTVDYVFYSPWREEERPVRGVLHGLFVFRAIVEFYKELYKTKKLSEAQDYISERVYQIKSEIELLKGFETSPGLTEAGSNLAISLLPLN